jgi:hypothetical protein
VPAVDVKDTYGSSVLWKSLLFCYARLASRFLAAIAKFSSGQCIQIVVHLVAEDLAGCLSRRDRTFRGWLSGSFCGQRFAG